MHTRLRNLVAKLPRGPVGWALWGVAAVGVIAALSFGPLLRGRLRAMGEKRGLEVDVGRMRLGWFALELSDVAVRPEGVAHTRLTVSEVDVHIDPFLRARRVTMMGGHVAVEGSPSEIADEWDAWRSRHRATSSGNERRSLALAGDAFSLSWVGETATSADAEGHGAPDHLEASGISFARDDRGTSVSVEDVQAKHDAWSGEASGLGVRISSEGALSELRAKSVAIELDTADGKKATDDKASGKPANAPAGGHPEPLVPLPNLHAMRARVALMAKALASRWAPDGALHVDGLSFRVGGEKKLSLGPGPLSLTRQNDRMMLVFSTDRAAAGASAGTPLSVHGELPLERGDLRLSFAGGPVALSALGVKEGAAGLADVSRGMLQGKGSLVLSDAGDGLAFDVDLGAKNLSISDPRLADDVVRGLALGARARGALTDKAGLRLDDAEATLGALHLDLRGTLEQTADDTTGNFSFAVPEARCQSLFESIPSALLPTLKGAEMKGTFGGKGTLRFDSRNLDDLGLDYDFDDLCKLTVVPPDLEKARFSKPFFHRVYLSDGTGGEEETGPGTVGWTDLGAISPYMQVAVLTTEDAAFYRHHGFNHHAIRESVIANLKARRFARGASTITMQLAKNLFLSREKTLSRKFEEIVLASYLEQNFSKQEIMELYFNVVEFGPDLYGITRATDHYFGRKPDEIHLGEAFFLSSLLPRPLTLHKFYEHGELPESWSKTLRSLMETAFKRGTISRGELNEGLSEAVVFHPLEAPRPPPRPPVLGSRLFEQSIQK